MLTHFFPLWNSKMWQPLKQTLPEASWGKLISSQAEGRNKLDVTSQRLFWPSDSNVLSFCCSRSLTHSAQRLAMAMLLEKEKRHWMCKCISRGSRYVRNWLLHLWRKCKRAPEFRIWTQNYCCWNRMTDNPIGPGFLCRVCLLKRLWKL